MVWLNFDNLWGTLLSRRVSLRRSLVESLLLAFLEFSVISITYNYFGTYYPTLTLTAVVVNSLLFGKWLGIFYAVALSIACDYLFIPPIGSIFENSESIHHFILICGVSLFSALLMSSLNEAYRKIAIARLEEESAKNEAEQANQAKDIFLANLSHELRTPLSSILAWSQLMQNSEITVDKMRHGLETIERSAKAQGYLIDDLLDITRIQAGKLALNFVAVEGHDLVRSAVESVQFLADHKLVTINVECPATRQTILGDSGRMQQVLKNLLTNAIKFSPAGATVTVRVENQEESWLVFRVIDQGKGVQKEFLPKLFERFTQADNTSIRVHGGLGLGLAIARNLVELHGGSLHAASEGHGKGATFTAQIPLHHAPAAHPTNAHRVLRHVPDLRGIKILIVEDEPSVLEVINKALASFGAANLACASAAEALRTFVDFHPDIIVSDVAMPGEDGYSFIRKMRARGATMPALALTAHAGKEDLKLASNAGFQAHMAKPFDLYELGHAVLRLRG